MPTQTTILTNVTTGDYVESGRWGAESGPKLAGSDKWFIAKRRLRGGLSDGVDVVEINNGALSVSVLPTRGMGLWFGSYRGAYLGWNSPVVNPVHPSFVNQQDRNGLGWLAGFNEWLCRCGLSSFGPPGLDRIRDAAGNVVGEWPLTLHGKIANLAAHHVRIEIDDTDAGTLRVVGIVDEASLFGPRLQLVSTLETTIGSNRIRIIDEVTNLSGLPGELMMLYHINVGKPYLEEGARLVHASTEWAPRDAHAAKDADRWDTYLPPTADYAEQCYFLKPAANERGEAVALLRNAAGTRGMTVTYQPKQLPCFTQWKNTRSMADGYVTGIEPGTGFPNLRTFEREQGRVVTLAPDQTYRMELELAAHDNPSAIRSIEEAIHSLKTRTPGQRQHAPRPDWSNL